MAPASPLHKTMDCALKAGSLEMTGIQPELGLGIKHASLLDQHLSHSASQPGNHWHAIILLLLSVLEKKSV